MRMVECGKVAISVHNCEAWKLRIEKSLPHTGTLRWEANEWVSHHQRAPNHTTLLKISQIATIFRIRSYNHKTQQVVVKFSKRNGPTVSPASPVNAAI